MNQNDPLIIPDQNESLQNNQMNMQADYMNNMNYYNEHNKNVYIDNNANNFMYMPQYNFNDYQYNQINQGGDGFNEAQSQWQKKNTGEADQEEEEVDQWKKKNKSSEKVQKKEDKNAAKNTNNTIWLMWELMVNVGFWAYTAWLLIEQEVSLKYSGYAIEDQLFGQIFWGVQFCYQMCCCEVARYLRNKKCKDSTKDTIEAIWKEKPRCYFHMQCQHQETRQRTITETDKDGKTKTRTETQQERVTTHTAREEFFQRQWTDRSISINRMIEATKCLRLNSIKKLIFFDSKTERKWNKKYNQFVRYHSRDVHNDHYTSTDISGFESEILSTDTNQWWSSQWIQLLLSLINFNSIQAYQFQTNSKVQKYPILKIISQKKRIDRDSDDSDCSDDD